MRKNTPGRSRGFTLIEMMTSVFIIGLILLLIGYEFDHALNHLLHTQSNTDAESSARVIMTKINNGLRAATPDVQDFKTNSPVISLPLPKSTGNVLSFYRVRLGSLTNPAAVPTDGQGAPAPLFELVTIKRTSAGACRPATANELEETRTDPLNPLIVLGTRTLSCDVTNFTVSNLKGDATSGRIDISLTVASRSVRCSPKCSYVIANSVEVGGLLHNE